jgi:hypothetical protein
LHPGAREDPHIQTPSMQLAGSPEKATFDLNSLSALGVQLDGLIALARIVLADDLDEASVARARRLGDDNAIGRRVLAAGAAKSNANHGVFPVRRVVHNAGFLAPPEGPERTQQAATSKR